ncbi:MAG: hypothetical protein AAF555_06865 [Verrucomicrobiota bacterium]
MAEATTTWPELAIGLFEKLNERNAEIVYDFENFEVSVPSKVGPDTPSALWKVNGILKIRTRDGVPA